MFRSISMLVLLFSALMSSALLASPELQKKLETQHRAFLEDRRQALPSLSDPFGVPPSARVVIESSRDKIRNATPWKRNVIATIFWIGKKPTERNPASNDKSAWDLNWLENFGGTDDPDEREGWNPKGFVPKLTPFYVALPYNDVMAAGLHRPEASEVVPWFWRDYRGDGISVCKGRWVAIHLAGKVCYAKWEDVGPFEVDHWQYVFGDQAPKDNVDGGSGIEISPAVRDFLNLKSGERVQWRFMDERDVPPGPWKNWAKGDQ